MSNLRLVFAVFLAMTMYIGRQISRMVDGFPLTVMVLHLMDGQIGSHRGIDLSMRNDPVIGIYLPPTRKGWGFFFSQIGLVLGVLLEWQS